MRNRLLGTALLGAVVLSLSGCLSITANVSVNPDATASGTLALGVSKEIAPMLGITSTDNLKAGVTSGDLAGGNADALKAADCKPTENDKEFVLSCGFTNETFADPKGTWTLARDGDTLTMHIQNVVDAGSAEMFGDMNIGAMNITAVFPGDVQSITGAGATKVDATTVAVTGSMSKNIDVTITANATGGGGLPAVLQGVMAWILVGLATIAAAVLGVILLVGHRQSASEQTDPVTDSESGAPSGDTSIE